MELFPWDQHKVTNVKCCKTQVVHNDRPNAFVYVRLSRKRFLCFVPNKIDSSAISINQCSICFSILGMTPKKRIEVSWGFGAKNTINHGDNRDCVLLKYHCHFLNRSVGKSLIALSDGNIDILH